MDEEKIKKSENSQTGLDKTVQVLGVVFGIVVTIIKWCFIATMFTLGTIFWLLDLWLGDGRNPISAPWDKPRRRPSNFDFDAWRRKNSTQAGDQFVKNNPKFRPENQQERFVYQAIRESSGKTLEEIISEMSEEEFERFIAMLLRAIGITVV